MIKKLASTRRVPYDDFLADFFADENSLLFFLDTSSFPAFGVVTLAAAPAIAAVRSSRFFPPDLNFPDMGVAVKRKKFYVRYFFLQIILLRAKSFGQKPMLRRS